MLEHDRAVTDQMLNELDGAPLGPAEQSGEPPLALDQRQVVNLIWDYGLKDRSPLQIALGLIHKCLARVRK